MFAQYIYVCAYGEGGKDKTAPLIVYACSKHICLYSRVQEILTFSHANFPLDTSRTVLTAG